MLKFTVITAVIAKCLKATYVGVLTMFQVRGENVGIYGELCDIASIICIRSQAYTHLCNIHIYVS